MGLASLDAALSGLRIAQQQISVISNNVANVGTPGFSRKILPQSSQAIEGVTVGVIGNTVVRNVSLNLARDLWTQVSSVGHLDVQQTYLARIQQFHGDPSKNLSVAAELSALMDTFSALADVPEDTFLRSQTINKAEDFSNKVNELSKLITTQRNDVQNEMQTAVARVNDLLKQISTINGQVNSNNNLGRTTAVLEDKRDDAIKELSSLMDISFFQRGDGVLVVQTSEGVELASNIFTPLTFRPKPLGPASYYPAPGSAAGIFVGDPITNPVSAVDITDDAVGGRLGGLIELRDSKFPKQMAQLDEMAHKTALRFEAQGLRLFTDETGSVPLDTAPDPTTLPAPTAVTYVGFSTKMRVNPAILNDNSLIQSGTYGASLPAGSNEVIRRVIQNAFGNVNYQEAGNTDPVTQVDLLNTGGDDLQTWLGLFSTNNVSGGRNLGAFTSPANFIASADGDLAPTSDTFRLTFEEPRTGLGPVNLDISLSAIPDTAGNFTQDLIAYITGTFIPALPAGDQADLVAMDVQFTESANGQLVINTRGSYVVDATNPANPMGQTGLSYLGFSQNIGAPVAPNDPYFDIAVGNNPTVRITLEPGDTSVDLLAKLDAVPGLAVDTVNFAIDGVLRLRPGNDYDFPDFGGDLKITSGPFAIAGSSYGAPPATSVRTTLANGGNIVSALFGTYTGIGPGAQNTSPIIDYGYESIEDGSAGTPSFLAFRETLLGPNAGIESRISGASSIIDYAQKMVSEQSQEIVLVQSRLADEQALRTVIEKQFLDDGGVNLDEELGNLITVQTAYSAAARVVSAVDDLFKELLNAIR
jgi:flagellar hook-associated protein 1 FlgK